MKRFTETTKWADAWFQDLPIPYRLLYLYILDNCDQAGVWAVNLKLAAFQIGMYSEIGAIKEVPGEFSERIVELAPAKWWVMKFIQFQYGHLSRDCKPHSLVFAALDRHGLPESELERMGLFQRLSKGIR